MLSEYWKRFYEETGEVRPPHKGEWFVNYTQGMPVQADFDFTEQAFHILMPKLEDRGNDNEGEEGRDDG